jgi:hypothetical protein
MAEARVAGAKPTFGFFSKVQQIERHGELGRAWGGQTLE